ncbi:MAG: hypothetical protein R6V58_04360 [Planctomycetota bacterium]
MQGSDRIGHWIKRAIGAIVVAGAAFGLLSLFGEWGLSVVARVAVSVGLAALYLVIGGSIWRWIGELLD